MAIKRDWFLWGVVLATVLAIVFPEPGATGGWLHAGWLSRWGVAAIFLLHGFNLPLASLRDGLLRWSVHLVVQLQLFVLFPLAAVLLNRTLAAGLPPEMRLGLLFLAALPSTVASAAVFTGVARGNVSAAVCNATLSNLLAIVLTPVWVLGLGRMTAASPALGSAVWDLTRLMLIPLLAGQGLRLLANPGARALGARLQPLDRVIILWLVYLSVSDTIVGPSWAEISVGSMAVLAALVILLLGAAHLAAAGLARMAGFSREDRIVVILSGSQKSLATGVPMANLLFAGNPALGLLLLPVILYHPLQLVVGGVLAARWARADPPQEDGKIST